MPVKFIFNNPQMDVWMLIHQTYYSVLRCEEKLFTGTGLTTQQHAILMAIKNADGPATPTQIADWVDRNLNSITLIVDRMEKSGLVKRVRDVRDRRSLRIVMTEKGEQYLKQNTTMSWQLIKDLLKVLSEEEMRQLAGLLEKVRQQAIEQCNGKKSLREVNISEQQHLSEFLNKAINGQE